MVYGEQWEYEVVSLSLSPEKQKGPLNKMGFQGWELVNVTSPDSNWGQRAYFKRKKG